MDLTVNADMAGMTFSCALSGDLSLLVFLFCILVLLMGRTA